jgi:salicylate hydroxylase
MNSETFHILGGGIAGLASAIAVANSGNRAIVMEKAEKFEALGAGLQLGPNAVRALQKLGAWDAVEPITSSPPEIQIRNGKSGKLVIRMELGKKFEHRFGMPYRVAHRADLLHALLEVAISKSSIEIQTNAEIINFQKFKNVIAADGVWSKTRQALFPGSAAIVTQEVFHRALVTTTTANECVGLWLYPGGHVVHYPVGHPAKLNLVAITQGQDVETHFAHACDELKTILTIQPEWQKWPAAFVRPLKRWHQGKVTLIGDAAHASLPYLAQGAAMAVEDAAALGHFLKSENEVELAFNLLGSERLKRTERIINASSRSGKIYHLTGALALARDLFLKTAPSGIISQQTSWIYES